MKGYYQQNQNQQQSFPAVGQSSSKGSSSIVLTGSNS